jgi:hypothetical protein
MHRKFTNVPDDTAAPGGVILFYIVKNETGDDPASLLKRKTDYRLWTMKYSCFERQTVVMKLYL